MRISAAFFVLLFIFSCAGEGEIPSTDNTENTTVEIADTAAISQDTTMTESAQYTAAFFETPDLGWGYKIYDNGTLFINQPHIPAIQGNKGFSSREKAKITADYVISKMEQGFIPPTISPEELDSLGVLD